MNSDKQKLLKWFNGEVYTKGSIVENPFSGEEYELNNIELSMYDFVMGATIASEMGMTTSNNEIVKDLRKGLSWFRSNNAEAYMALLD